MSALAALLCRGDVVTSAKRTASGFPPLSPVALFTREDAPGDIAHFRDTSAIYGPELFTVVAAISSMHHTLRNRPASVYLGINADLPALIKADSSSAPVSRLISLARYAESAYNITLWFGRVSSALNIADPPPRGETLSAPLPPSSRFDLPSVRYCDDYTHTILQNVRDVAESKL